jgi:hypothetical protein
VRDIVLALALFCAPAQVDVGDLIKGSNTPDGPSPGITRSPGHRRFCPTRHDATGNDAGAQRPKHTVDQLEEGGANADFGGVPFAVNQANVAVVNITFTATFSGPLGLPMTEWSSRYRVPESSLSGTEYRNESIDLRGRYHKGNRRRG